jgi:predicted CXXCH cytochrome family protein
MARPPPRRGVRSVISRRATIAKEGYVRLRIGVFIGVLFASAPAFAQRTSVVAGGPHDLSSGSAVRNTNATIDGQTCVFCHTPHGGANNIALWNRSGPTGAAYQMYTSSTSDVTATAAQLANSGSGACLSCHDGTIAMDVVTNVNGVAFGPAVSFTRQGTAKSTYTSTGSGSNNVMSGGLPFLGTDLRNDHPVAIIYETARAAKPTEFVTQVISGAKITAGSGTPLFGTTTANATVECASCHNAHNNSLGNFLRRSNTGSAMCLSCHIK